MLIVFYGTVDAHDVNGVGVGVADDFEADADVGDAVGVELEPEPETGVDIDLVDDAAVGAVIFELDDVVGELQAADGGVGVVGDDDTMKNEAEEAEAEKEQGDSF